MNSADWKQYWEEKSHRSVSDFEFDRGRLARDEELERLSAQELLDFISPRSSDVVLDAGCGTGSTRLLIHSTVKTLIAMDYAEAAVVRCAQRCAGTGVGNVLVLQADMMRIPLPDRSVDKVLCLSVLQYLDDTEARRALGEAARVLADGGIMILHVKNLSSLYFATLVVAKRVKRRLGMRIKAEHARAYRWYVTELRAAGFDILAYNSFNVLIVEAIPRRVVDWIRMLELRHRGCFPLRSAFVRRHGAELKIRATIRKSR